jgi:hypothetical protein
VPRLVLADRSDLDLVEPAEQPFHLLENVYCPGQALPRSARSAFGATPPLSCMDVEGRVG